MMINRAKLLFMTTALLTLPACNSVTQLPAQMNQNYAVGKLKSSRVGDTMIARENIQMIQHKQWIGVLYSPDGWRTSNIPTDNSFKEELIYTGKTGGTISVSYREYKSEFARPAFFQELKYDLSQSSDIVFRNYRINVESATNESIKFVVVQDR